MDNVVVLDDCSPTSKGDSRDSQSRKRSRSRSPNSNNRQHLYESEGTNTTSDRPDLQRARLFVGNVDHRMNKGELRKAFSRYGEVLGVSIHSGFAFVQLDSEKNAKDAIIGEDSRSVDGTLLHVEFSQAAKKAGAKYEEVEKQLSRRKTSPKPLASRSRRRNDDYDDQLRDREAKLARVLAMEKELAYYQSQDRYSRRPPSDHYDRRHRRDFSPQPQPSLRDYDRSYGRRDPLYGRSSPPMSLASKSSMGGYRDKPRPSGYESRDYAFGRGEQSVGYGGSPGGREKSPVGSLGWPASSYSKSQRPFSGSSPWN